MVSTRDVAFDEAVDAWLRFDPAVVALVEGLSEESSDDRRALAASLALSGTDARDVAAARELVGPGEPSGRTDHLAAARAWASGTWRVAADLLDEILLADPGDALALFVGHQLDFFLGDAARLRDRVGRVLPALDPDAPRTGYARGLFAFGLEESGHYQRAEQEALAALDRNPDDVWAIHAAVHCYEMEGEVERGLAFLDERRPVWSEGNLFAVHNWWHEGLYRLERGDVAGVLRIWDERVNPPDAAGVPIELLDATAMLWRLRLDGADVGPRFEVMADAWSAATDRQAPWYAFNDWHAVMAWVGAGRLDAARAHVARLEGYCGERHPPGVDNPWMTAEVGLPACRGVLAWGEGRFADSADCLRPVTATANRFGGSHAQRDALHRTLVDAAWRAGRTSVARAAIAEKLSLRPTSAWYRTRAAAL